MSLQAYLPATSYKEHAPSLAELLAHAVHPAALTDAEKRIVDIEIGAAEHVPTSLSVLEQCLELAARVPERIATDSAAVLTRIHEIAGAGNLESCRSSHPMVRALYVLGWANAKAERNVDWELVVGRGHIAPAFYAEEYVRGRLPFALLATLHRGCLPGVVHKDMGFLNTMGFSLGLGIGQATSRCFWLDRHGSKKKVVCLAGDGELHEGITYECLRCVDEREYSNLVLVVDANGKGIEPLVRELRVTDLAPFFRDVVEIDGTNEHEIAAVLRSSLASPQRTAIICRTKKGNHSFKPTGAASSSSKPRFSQRTGASIKRFLEQTTQEAVVITADMADRFGLRGNVPYMNVSLAETLSVALTLGLPPHVMKFVATDAKYYLDSLGTLLDVTATVERVVLLAGKSWGIWGGEPTALNTLAAQKNIEVYEPITDRELAACLRKVEEHPHEVHILSLVDSTIRDMETDCAAHIDGAVWMVPPKPGRGVVVSFGYATTLVCEALRGASLGHLHCASLHPTLEPKVRHALAGSPAILAIEYNGLVGGFGDHLRSRYRIACDSHAITRNVILAPHAVQLRHHGMDIESLGERLMEFERTLSSPSTAGWVLR